MLSAKSLRVVLCMQHGFEPLVLLITGDWIQKSMLALAAHRPCSATVKRSHSMTSFYRGHQSRLLQSSYTTNLTDVCNHICGTPNSSNRQAVVRGRLSWYSSFGILTSLAAPVSPNLDDKHAFMPAGNSQPEVAQQHTGTQQTRPKRKHIRQPHAQHPLALLQPSVYNAKPRRKRCYKESPQRQAVPHTMQPCAGV
jgi:hypothetical protein